MLVGDVGAVNCLEMITWQLLLGELVRTEAACEEFLASDRAVYQFKVAFQVGLPTEHFATGFADAT